MLSFLANVNKFIFWCDVVFCVLYFCSIFNHLPDETIQKMKLAKKKPDLADFLRVLLALLLMCFVPVINAIFLYLLTFNFAELRDKAVENVVEAVEKETF